MSNHYNEERMEVMWNKYVDSVEYDSDLRDLAIHRITYEEGFGEDVMSDTMCDLGKEDYDLAIVDPCEFGKRVSDMFLSKAMEWSEDALASNWQEHYGEPFDEGC